MGDDHAVGVGDRRSRGGGQRGWNDDVQVVLQQADAIARPAHGHGRGRQAVFQQQQQAHDPGHDLAHRGVGVGIGRARHRQGRRQLGVAKGHEGAEQAGDDERDGDRRPGELCGGAAGQHEDAGADDAAYAQQDQVQRPQGPLQLAMGVLGLDLRHGLAHEDAPDAPAVARTLRHAAVPYPFRAAPAAASGQAIWGADFEQSAAPISRDSVTKRTIRGRRAWTRGGFRPLYARYRVRSFHAA